MRHSTRFLFSAVLLLFFSGCGGWSNPVERIVATHRIDIQQGNVITQPMLDKLKPGMTPSQVRFIMGTPLIVDPFRNNRWDYVYSHEKAGKLVEFRRITVIFEDEKLKSLEGDVVAAAVRSEPAPAQKTEPEGSRK